MELLWMMKQEIMEEEAFLEHFNYYQYLSGRDEGDTKASAITENLRA
jgi:hypothetical protein